MPDKTEIIVMTINSSSKENPRAIFIPRMQNIPVQIYLFNSEGAENFVHFERIEVYKSSIRPVKKK